MTLEQEIAAIAVETGLVEKDLTAARTALQAAVTQHNDDVSTVAALKLTVDSIQKKLDDCEGTTPPPPPTKSYVFGVNHSDAYYTTFTNALAPAKIGGERIYRQGQSPPFGDIDAAMTAGHTVAFSFKPAATYVEVSNGSKDALLKSWATYFKGFDVPFFFDIFHEAENPSKAAAGTSAQLKAAWVHAMQIVKPIAPKVITSRILMGWTYNPSSGRVASDWIPSGADKPDVIGSDGYTWPTGGYVDPGPLFARTANLADSMGTGWGVFECNAPVTEPRKPEWIRGLAQIARDRHAACVYAFDMFYAGVDDWRSASNPAAMTAWREAATNRAWS